MYEEEKRGAEREKRELYTMYGLFSREQLYRKMFAENVLLLRFISEYNNVTHYRASMRFY